MSVPEVKLYLTIGLIFLNLFALSLFVWDRTCKKHHGPRVPEILLYTISLIGGSLGATMAVYFFRCKRRKIAFKILMPLFLLLHAAVLFVLGMGL